MEFKVEGLSSIKDRLPDALIDAHKVKYGELPMPTSRDNVFDFKGGLRLSILRSEDNTIHVIAGEGEGNKFLYPRGTSNEEIVAGIMKRAKQIGLIDIIGQSDTVATITESGFLRV